MTEAEFRRWLTSPDCDPERDVRLLEARRPHRRLRRHRSSGERPRAELVRPPASTRRIHAGDVAPILLRWVEERAGGGVLRRGSRAWPAGLKRAYERARPGLIRHSYRMQIDLETTPEAPAGPKGSRSGPVRERRRVSGLQGARGELRRTRGSTCRSRYEEWKHWFLDRDDFDPGLCFLAHDGDELAGVLLSRCRWRRSRTRATSQVLGVRRPWRRRGLGLALLRRSFQEFHDRGFARVRLGVDASSLTGANASTRMPACASCASGTSTRGRCEPAPRAVPGLQHDDRGRDRAGVPVPLLRARVRRRARSRSSRLGDGRRGDGRGGRAPLPYPETGVIEADTLAEQTLLLASELPERPLVLGRLLLLAHRGDRRARRRRGVPGGRLDRRARRPEHAGDVAVRERLGDAAADRDRRRRRRSRSTWRWSAPATSIRPRSSSSRRAGSTPATTRSTRARRCRRGLRRDRRSMSVDPGEVAVFMPEPGGLTLAEVERLLAAVAAAHSRARVSGSPGSSPTPANGRRRAPALSRSRPLAPRRV